MATPMLALAQSVAAVLTPWTLAPRWMITPAPMKPMPVTTAAASCAGLFPGPKPLAESIENPAAPSATSVLVLIPALLWCHWRSTPIAAPKTTASRRGRTGSNPSIDRGYPHNPDPQFRLQPQRASSGVAVASAAGGAGGALTAAPGPPEAGGPSTGRPSTWVLPLSATIEGLMTTLLAGYAFFLGAIIGSFLNVVIHRYPRGQSIVFPPSSCPHCGARIRAYDNIPVVSFLVLRGHCRRCHGPISVRYPLVELANGLFF